MIKMTKILGLIFLLFLPNFLMCKTIRFGLHWQPQAQFAGYIMAIEKGFFTEHDLDVELIFTEGVDLILNRLINGEFDYATSWLSQAIYLNRNEELLNLSQILQHSSLMIAGKRSSHIYEISDLNHKSISLWNGDFSVPLNAFLNKHNLIINRLPGKANIDLFMSDACDAASIMYYNEYNKIYLAGVDYDELTLFKFSDDKSLDFPEDGLYVRNDYYINNKSEAHNVRDAILKGWIYSLHNQEETIRTVLNYCNQKKLRTNYSEQKWMLEKILEAVFENNENFSPTLGILKESDYYKVANELKNQKLISTIISYENFVLRIEND